MNDKLRRWLENLLYTSCAIAMLGAVLGFFFMGVDTGRTVYFIAALISFILTAATASWFVNGC